MRVEKASNYTSAAMGNEDTTPRLLAEWTPQSAVLLSWPNPGIWQQHCQGAHAVYGQIISALTRYQDVILCHHDKQTQQLAKHYLSSIEFNSARLKHHLVANNDSWTRDYGPLSVSHNNDIQLIDYRFNGWGNKFAHSLDNKVCQQLKLQHAFGKQNLLTRNIILEGGSIDSDGRGTILTTRACLLNPNRNPQLSQADIESELAKTLGVKRFLWLENGFIAGDDTDGHIDMLARFCDANTIAYSSCQDKHDEHYEALTAMSDELKSFRSCDDNPYTLIALPIPNAIFDNDGQRLPASYSNFLIANKQVLLPTYDDPMDNVAEAALQKCFPDREIVPIDCRALIHQGGSLHCATMQIAML